MFEYIDNFKKLGFGLFVHFGLYSVKKKGEWFLKLNNSADIKEYEGLINSFHIKDSWAKELVLTAKEAGCKYITITTRHHDGFSLYDTCGLSEFDAPHSACKRDLIKEFVEACHEYDIIPFFYHTLLDWREKTYKSDFPKYIDYLIKSVEILCKNYGKIGGFWFDGMWDKDDDWQEDRLYQTIRKYQKDAMIINNTGLSHLGEVSHPEIDSVTFERGKPCSVNSTHKPIAGEMCQVLNDHWGYAEDDFNYKSVKELIENLIDCRKYNCNFLLNTGLKEDGSVNLMDACLLKEIGKWIKFNKDFIYEITSSNIKGSNIDIVKGKDCYYGIIKNVPMSGDINVQREGIKLDIKIDAFIKEARYLDNDEEIEIINNSSFVVKPFAYGTSGVARIIKMIL